VLDEDAVPDDVVVLEPTKSMPRFGRVVAGLQGVPAAAGPLIELGEARRPTAEVEPLCCWFSGMKPLVDAPGLGVKGDWRVLREVD
jgi:hypothetical protein